MSLSESVMKKILKYLGYTLASVLVAAIALALHTWYAKPLLIDWFYTKAFIKFAIDEPEMLTSIRVFEPFGIRGHNAKLSDSSIAGDAKRDTLLNELIGEFKGYRADNLTGQDAISHAIFDYTLKQRLNETKYRWHSFPITQLGGTHTYLPALMIQQQRIDDATDAEHFIARLNAYPTKMRQIAQQIDARTKRNIVPPKFAVDKTLVQIDEFIAKGVDNNALYKDFVERIEKIDAKTLNANRKNELKVEARNAIETAVLPAYRTLQKLFRDLQKVATKNEGAWSLPDGATYYRHAIEQHTTTTIDADTLHDLGLKDVARIGAQMDAILAKIEPAPGTRAEKLKRIIEDPKRKYPDTDEGRTQVLADYQKIIDEIAPAMEKSFRLKPKTGVVVKRVPTFAEKGAPAAYYEAPPLDGSALGVFYANLYNVNSTPKHGMRTLAYHEAIPGHHFQIAIAQSLDGLPFFRKLLGFTAYDEGWALYTEQLAWELGFQNDPYDNLGRLQDEMLRAVRLVVDTGIHAKRWSREQAIAYMVAETGMIESEVVTEIERYFVDPGQALAYKVGMFKILELRERAKTKLGAKFDIRDFHDVVLGNGSMPLSILERVVDEYIAAKQKS
jgi:uncharacterized protein (DUF885 family)